MRILNNYEKFINENNQTQIDKESVVVGKVNKIVDYTVIRPGTIKDKVKECINEAIEYGYYGIVVNPDLVDFAAYEVEDSGLKIVSTLDFPNGDMKSNEKLNESIKIISDGADEIDMVIDIDYFKKAYTQKDEELKNSSYISLENEIKDVANECHKNGVILKVVIESGELSLEELKDMCRIVENGNADFVQTSTGMKEVGAELSKVKEIRRLLPDYIKIKAAGGIRSIEDANKFYPFVDRIGTSSILK
jgi:deoxyribose-phosphate aldolase